MNIGFYILDPKDKKKHSIVPTKQWVVKVNNMEDKIEYNQFDEVPLWIQQG
jgi:hypothetical protein